VDPLDILCPFHFVLTEEGHVTHMGPSARKLVGPGREGTSSLFDLLQILAPSGVHSFDELLLHHGRRLKLRLRRIEGPILRGVFASSKTGGGILNLSLGNDVGHLATRFNLTQRDFAITENTVEMLFLIEAKNAAMQASRNLSERLQVARIAAEERAFCDALSGLGNRRAFEAMLETLAQQRAPFSLMNVDLDFFKQVNDTFGHAAGDHVIACASQILQQETRGKDMCFRTGGDEFNVIFPALTDSRVLERIGLRIIKALEKPIMFEEHHGMISASIGCAKCFGADFELLEQLQKDADNALYAAKRSGRGCMKFFN
jgi:diguanylate cyclase (GGDEF)-like protein